MPKRVLECVICGKKVKVNKYVSEDEYRCDLCRRMVEKNKKRMVGSIND